MLSSVRFVPLVAVLAFLPRACDDSYTHDGDQCSTRIESSTSPATGVLSLHGDFYADETVLLTYTSGGQPHQLNLTPGSNRSDITFVNVPSGTMTFGIAISCEAGRDERASKQFTVK